MAILAFFIGILILLILITLHELGHFIMAKIFKVYVYEFSIGFGPKIIKWKGKETLYSIRIFPFGGFVDIASEYTDPPKELENVEITDNRFIENVNRGKRILIVAAGILMNFIVAAFLFTSIFSIIGYSPNDLNGYGAKYYNDDNSPSHVLQLDKNSDVKNPNVITKIAFVYVDLSAKTIEWKTSYENNLIQINSINEKPLSFYQMTLKLENILKTNQKDSDGNIKNTIFVEYATYNYKTEKLNNDETLLNDTSIGYRYTKDSSDYVLKDHYIIGMKAPDFYFSSIGVAYMYGWKETMLESINILKSIGKIFTGQFSQLSGPIGAIEQTKLYIQSGVPSFFLYVAMLSANLFVLNLIPIAPLDGFKFLILLIETIIRRELNKKAKMFVTIIGAVLFLMLFIGLTIKDIFL